MRNDLVAFLALWGQI